MHPDYLRLADQYASFLIALGGVSVTVLALILTLLKPPHSKSYAASVTALVVATLACFVGAHLMSQTTALKDPPGVQEKIANASQTSSVTSQTASVEQPTQEPPLGGRHFIYASIDVYVALMLNSFAMMLLPTAYLRRGKKKRGEKQRETAAGQAMAGNLAKLNLLAGEVAFRVAPAQNIETGGVSEQDAAGISKITRWVFQFVLISSFFWSMYFYIARINRFESYTETDLAAIFALVLAVIFIVWSIYFVLLRWAVRNKHFPQLTFYLLILVIAFSGIRFMLIRTVREQITVWDAWSFCVAVTISGIVLAGHSLRLTGRGSVKYRPFPWAYTLYIPCLVIVIILYRLFRLIISIPYRLCRLVITIASFLSRKRP